MKLSEFDQIRKFLPDDFEIELKGVVPTPKFIKETWGNHDGRYNMRCEACGYITGDIPRNQLPPIICPKCGKSKYQGD